MLQNLKYWDSGLEQWVAKTAAANLWKLGAWNDLDDMKQEALLVYCKCLNGFRFERTPSMKNPDDEEQRAFMAYFKSSYENRLRDLAWGRGPEANFASLSREGEQEVESTIDVPQSEATSAHMALLQAPSEVLGVLKTLVQDAQEAGAFLRSRLRRRIGYYHKTGAFICSERLERTRSCLRETNAQHYERRCGRHDAIDLLKSYLSA